MEKLMEECIKIERKEEPKRDGSGVMKRGILSVYLFHIIFLLAIIPVFITLSLITAILLIIDPFSFTSHLSIYLQLSLLLSVYPPLHLSLSLSLSNFPLFLILLSIYPSLHLSIHVHSSCSIHLSIYLLLSIDLSSFPPSLICIYYDHHGEKSKVYNIKI